MSGFSAWPSAMYLFTVPTSLTFLDWDPHLNLKQAPGDLVRYQHLFSVFFSFFSIIFLSSLNSMSTLIVLISCFELQGMLSELYLIHSRIFNQKCVAPFLKVCLFIYYLFERESRRFYSPSPFSSWGWTRSKLRANNSVQVSHVASKTQMLEPPPAASPSAH